VPVLVIDEADAGGVFARLAEPFDLSELAVSRPAAGDFPPSAK
jgi:hypothetical protein